MADRRMFHKTIVLSDAFLDMPPTARCLYFTLAILADDDGFINSPKSIMRQSGATIDDMNILLAKKYILAFDDGIVVVKHWWIHNYIAKDRYTPTKYAEDKALLTQDENKAYRYLDTDCIQPVSNPSTQDRLGEVKTGKNRGRFTPPTPDEVNAYCKDKGYAVDGDRFVAYYEQQGWKLSNGNKMVSWQAACSNWAARDKAREKSKLNTGASERAYEQNELRAMVNDPLRDYLEAEKNGEL